MQYKGKVEGDDVAFKDFLRYIANDVEPEYMNEHYMPMTTLCQPCLVNYDFIGIYDNLVEDSEVMCYCMYMFFFRPKFAVKCPNLSIS